MFDKDLLDLVQYVESDITNQKAYDELSTDLGSHRVLPKRHVTDPVKNLELVLDALYHRIHKQNRYFTIDSIEYGGYMDREAIINYTVISEENFKEIRDNHPSQILNVY